MKNLRLAWKNEQGDLADITLPMETWITDWWFACNIVPSNDAIIHIAELDGKSVLPDIKSIDARYVKFEEIARHFGWNELYCDFVSEVAHGHAENSSDPFEAWLKQSADKKATL